MDERARNSLIVFLKYPEPGMVKTRLARDIGEGQAARVYGEMAENVIRNTSSPEDYDSLIFYTPRERGKGIRKWLGAYKQHGFVPQSGGDLGERMLGAFNRVFSLGYERAIVIGTDCLHIAKEGINRAFHCLGDSDVVIGPADDGGYYLLGLKEPYSFLFENVEWGTQGVLERTLAAARSAGLSVAKLDVLPDIDTYEDLLLHRPDLLSGCL